ncbi:hypothetical protein BY996DRAFT_6410671 [Phakopsora pachyrhizi]|uniref:Expressed protein n=1 Tax=Phakopsora pachyrhizi TaxID=170000 RepID=A0AAV0BE98_PHAPC|nr:hypothetical protein BY996DRAFT_6410671 [Phakopsora pachyrhizi]CAH7685554.1 expressed protein [Phakopsora pachyrhizi]
MAKRDKGHKRSNNNIKKKSQRNPSSSNLKNSDLNSNNNKNSVDNTNISNASSNNSSSNRLMNRKRKGRARTRASGLMIYEAEDEVKLNDQLKLMGLYAANTLGDGNCLFRALSDQLHGTPSDHYKIRKEVVDYLSKNKARYEDFVDVDEDQSYEKHLEEMSKLGTYGGHLELNGFANLIRRPIKVIQPGMVYVIGYDQTDGAEVEKSTSNGDVTFDEDLKSLPSSSSGVRTRSSSIKGKTRSRQSSSNSDCDSNHPLYIVYHKWEHYSSVRNIDGPHSGLPLIVEAFNKAGMSGKAVVRDESCDENRVVGAQSTKSDPNLMSIPGKKTKKESYRDQSPTSNSSSTDSSSSNSIKSPSSTSSSSSSTASSSKMSSTSNKQAIKSSKEKSSSSSRTRSTPNKICDEDRSALSKKQQIRSSRYRKNELANLNRRGTRSSSTTAMGESTKDIENDLDEEVEQSYPSNRQQQKHNTKVCPTYPCSCKSKAKKNRGDQQSSGIETFGLFRELKV